jgi:hypothetical protein
LQVEHWSLLWKELTRDASAVAQLRGTESARDLARREMASLLERYRRGELSTAALSERVDRGTRREWSSFGLRGPSGTLFLRQLATYVPEPTLGPRLRAAVAAPRDVREARRRLRTLVFFLDGLVRTAAVPSRVLQPARAVFLVTMAWHLQQPAQWPAFHLSARHALRREQGLFAPTGDHLDDYFSFRSGFLALASALRLTTVQLEQLCWWHERRERHDERTLDEEPLRFRAARRSPVRLASRGAPAADRTIPLSVVREPEACRANDATLPYSAVGDHTHLQWLLATIGRRLGYRVWIAANDWGKAHEGETLGSLSEPSLPSLGISAEARRVVSLIDVLWLRGEGEVAAAFEVEHTTSVCSGLLRMADLASLSPNLAFPLYVVAPEERLDKVRRELSRPTLQALGLHRRSAFFSSQALEEAAPSIIKWGSDISAIDRIASRLHDTAPHSIRG